jgi:hypothetical protein
MGMNVISWLTRMVPGGQSVRAVVECCNRADRLRNEGRLAEAFAAGIEGLSLRRALPQPQRRAAGFTALVSLTVLVEELASELDSPGADERDVAESITGLKNWDAALVRFPDLANGESPEVGRTRAEWLAYLEQRLAARRRTTRCS